MAEDIIYNDVNGIRITSKRFYKEDNYYNLDKIKKIYLDRVATGKKQGLLIFLLGIIGIVTGSLEFMSTVSIDIGNELWLVDLNYVLIGIGVTVILVAIIRMMFAEDEYAVKVETKDGETTSVISNNRKYVARVAASLKRAYYRQEANSESDEYAVIA
ncbi:MAG: DUF6232 family protein [Fulvivirga sp.]|nr:DUF6232 family protein [Fulvivirga sp.]